MSIEVENEQKVMTAGTKSLDRTIAPSRLKEAYFLNGHNIFEIERLNLTDPGYARLFAIIGSGDLLFCSPWGKWIVWDGKRWRRGDAQS